MKSKGREGGWGGGVLEERYGWKKHERRTFRLVRGHKALGQEVVA